MMSLRDECMELCLLWCYTGALYFSLSTLLGIVCINVNRPLDNYIIVIVCIVSDEAHTQT